MQSRISGMKLLSLFIVIWVLVSAASLACGQTAQSVTRPVPARVVTAIDESKLVALRTSVSPAVRGAVDLGVADQSQPAGKLFLGLKRSADQETDLKQFLQQSHSTGSANYHKWLTPEQFGAKFGPADSDIQQVTAWLQSKGLTVSGISKGKNVIEFTGTVGQVSTAFRTSIHKYEINGEVRHANATAPYVPAALAPVVRGVGTLNDFPTIPLYQRLGKAAMDPVTRQATALWTDPSLSATKLYYLLTPSDFATQYNLNPVYAAGLDGKGQTIGILSDANIDLAVVNAWRKLFGLPDNPPQVVVVGTDPGLVNNSIEAYLDVENAGGVAPNATIKLYAGGYVGLLGSSGLIPAIVYAVEENAAPVLSLSYATAEINPPEWNALINSLWEQAAAQGQTVVVASGDNGSQDGFNSLGVNAFASSPWVVAVGGTDAYYHDYATGGKSITNYWNATNTSTWGSLAKPFLEQPWNNTQYGLNSTTYDPVAYQPYYTGAGGGGPSRCAYSTYNEETWELTCLGGYEKPSWQVGTGVPDDGVRDIPDVSLFAGSGKNGVAWPVAEERGDAMSEIVDQNNQPIINLVGGTSAGTPAFAGIMALINQKYGPQGQANFVLYPLAKQFPTVYNPIDVGSNNVWCYMGVHAGCAENPDQPGTYSMQGYSAHYGYDLASGWGSPDVAVLVNNWNKITFEPTTTTLTATPTTAAHGEPITVTVNVAGGSGTPTGRIAFVTDSDLPLQAGQSNAGTDRSGLSVALDENGAASITLTTLPGGSYSLYAKYSGDGAFGASTSAPVSLTIGAEDSELIVTPEYPDDGLMILQMTGNPSIKYGAPITIQVQPRGKNLAADASVGLATGTITFTDGGTTLATIPLSSTGSAQYRTDAFSVGSHSITVSYSGDASYNPSTAGPITFTIVKGEVVYYLKGDETKPFHTGQDITYTVALYNNPYSALSHSLPTGTMTYQFGDRAPITVPVVPGAMRSFTNEGMGDRPNAMANARITNLPEGTTPLIITYSGDENFNSHTETDNVTATAPTLSITTTTIELVDPVDASTITPLTPVTVRLTVRGDGTSSTAPTGTVWIMSSTVTNFGSVKLPTGGTGDTSVLEASFMPDWAMPGMNQVNAEYLGDSTHYGSTSDVINILDNNEDFTMVAQNPKVVVAGGSSTTAVINISSQFNFHGNVALGLSGVPDGMSVSLSSTTVAVNGYSTVTLNIDAFTTKTVYTAMKTTGNGAFGFIGMSVFACMLVGVTPLRRRCKKSALGVLAVAILATAIGCGDSGTVPPPPPPPHQVTTPTPAGTYHVLVTGTGAEGRIHTVPITVIVK